MIYFTNKEQTKNKDYVSKVLHTVELPSEIRNPENFEILTGGSRSIAIKIEDFVIRFPISEKVLENQKREACLCRILKNNLPNDFHHKIPDVKTGKGFVWHKMIDGRIFDKQVHLSSKQEDRLAFEIAFFLCTLHQIPLSTMDTVDLVSVSAADDWNFTHNPEWDYQTAYELLKMHDIDLETFKVEIDNRTKAVCHNDLSGSNILIDTEKSNPLTGIIDFGNTAIMPLSNEFVPFYKISRQFAHKVISHYNRIAPYKVNITEVDYKALSFIGLLLIKIKKSSFCDLMIENFKN